jgi:membrane protein YdbS with pleckstrin-like domain
MKWLSKKSLLICLTLLMLVVVVVSIIVTTGMPVREDAVNMVLEGWTTEQVIDPPDEPYYSGEKTVYQLVTSHKVTSEMRGRVISFRTNDSYVDAYLTDVAGTPEDDAVHIYHFGESLRICDSPGTYTHFIRLPESAVGQVTICVETVYANKFMPSYEVAIGTQNELLFNYLRQNLLMKIFGMVSLHIRCPGYGSRRDTLPVLIPLVRKKNSQALLEKLHAVPVMEHPKLHARSNIRFFWSFVWPPVIGLCAILPARFILLWLLPNLGAIIRFCSVMLIIPLVWLLCIRIVAMFTESVTMDDQYLQMHFCSWFTFHTITVNHARIVRTDLMQTPAQKMYGVCHLYITCNGPRQQRFKLTALPEAKAREIVETLARTEMQDMS